jgi:hypothetical protein
MSDNKNNIGNPDRERISLSEDYEIQSWSKRFGVSREELVNAVKRVGNSARKVEEFLKGRK